MSNGLRYDQITYLLWARYGMFLINMISQIPFDDILRVKLLSIAQHKQADAIAKEPSQFCWVLVLGQLKTIPPITMSNIPNIMCHSDEHAWRALIGMTLSTTSWTLWFSIVPRNLHCCVGNDAYKWTCSAQGFNWRTPVQPERKILKVK